MLAFFRPYFMHESWLFSFSSLIYLSIIILLILFSIHMLFMLRETRRQKPAKEVKDDQLEKFSHSIRTPLNSIMGYCQILLSDKEINMEQKQYLTTISDNSGYLLDQISNLLDDSATEIPVANELFIQKCTVKNILIVDDVSVNRAFLKIMLERHGYELTEAQNGKEALQLIKSEAPDLVLMDIMMPVMDGLEALKVIRACEGKLADIPVIAVTANNVKTSRESLLKAGFTGLLQKPFLEEDLLKLINN